MPLGTWKANLSLLRSSSQLTLLRTNRSTDRIELSTKGPGPLMEVEEALLLRWWTTATLLPLTWTSGIWWSEAAATRLSNNLLWYRRQSSLKDRSSQYHLWELRREGLSSRLLKYHSSWLGLTKKYRLRWEWVRQRILYLTWVWKRKGLLLYWTREVQGIIMRHRTWSQPMTHWVPTKGSRLGDCHQTLHRRRQRDLPQSKRSSRKIILSYQLRKLEY